jgi:hypothetical protein
VVGGEKRWKRGRNKGMGREKGKEPGKKRNEEKEQGLRDGNGKKGKIRE